MSIAESIIYTAFVGIALAIVYSSTLSHSGNLIDRLFNKAKEQKHEVKGKLKCATIEPQDIPTHLAQSTFEGNSWTEEKIFQLEKRAIFSKVGLSAIGPLYRSWLIYSIGMDLCHTCLKIS